MRPTLRAAGTVGLLAGVINAITVDFNDDASIKDGASTVAFGLLKYYTGNNTGDVPGNLPDPYFWWECGAMFGTLVDYWHYTGDTTYNDLTLQGLVHQAGEDKDFMPQNQSRSLGNDDQGFWALTAMTAAETNFQNPPEGQPQWLALVQAVFNEYVMRWKEASDTCGGGLRWQIFTFNNGFNYKNSISNGCFFNIAARLARYTGNETYADWAEKVWDWMEEIKFIDADYNIYDGAGVEDDCTEVNPQQWTYNAGIFLEGAAIMYNFTEGNRTWETRTRGLAQRSADFFFDDGVVVERPCESGGLCDNDQQTFKGFLLRWMAAAVQVAAPVTSSLLTPLLMASAKAAAASCDGTTGDPLFKGVPGTACGFSWTAEANDNLVGVGEQMSALSALQYTLLSREQVAAPFTADTGGTSVGDPDAGADSDMEKMITLPPITTGDKVAAGFLTSAVAFSVVGGSFFVMRP
ncbi:glycoside hydrolase family 76 protein [Xylariomycetidae sp. FL0641]|nr:glycoside hydrolase family 76 protein [Xylariomycetidae sp. FL0641]